MTYIIAEPCIDVKDKSCIDVCPVDCIHEYDRMLVIDPEECIDCGACEPECPVEAIYPEDALPDKWEPFVKINYAFPDADVINRSSRLRQPSTTSKTRRRTRSARTRRLTAPGRSHMLREQPPLIVCVLDGLPLKAFGPAAERPRRRQRRRAVHGAFAGDRRAVPGDTAPRHAGCIARSGGVDRLVHLALAQG